MSFVPIDTRMCDHPNTLRLAREFGDRHRVVGLLCHLWGLLYDLETEFLEGSPSELEELYGWPAGWIEALEGVGWAITKSDSCRFPTRNYQGIDKAAKRSEAASKAANARWDAKRRGASKRIKSASDSASGAASCGNDAEMPQRDREIPRDASPHAAAAEGSGSGEREITIRDIRSSLAKIGTGG